MRRCDWCGRPSVGIVDAMTACEDDLPRALAASEPVGLAVLTSLIEELHDV